MRNRYIPVFKKFIISHATALIWMFLSIFLSLKWLHELSVVVSFPLALFIIAGIAYIPGYFNAFLVVGLLLDKQPSFKVDDPDLPVSILISAWNEESGITDTLRFIKNQDYKGKIHVYLIDNNSTDNTVEIANEYANKIRLQLFLLEEKTPGKNFALNYGLQFVETDLVITLDADTLLHPLAIKNIVRRFLSSPNDVCSVAGTVLVRNSRENWLAKVQEWDYFLAIASIKRLQGLFQGTLVAQGAFSLYKTESIREIGGWTDHIGEDIVLTWRFLEKGWKVYFEPTSISFTNVPTKLSHYVKQRSRWARGMIEALKLIKPWKQGSSYTKYLTTVNLFMPYIDFSYTLFWIPGFILSFFGMFLIVGPITLLVLPFTFLSYMILFYYQRKVFHHLNLRIRKNISGFMFFMLFYQLLMSPVSVWGYIQEFFNLRRVWK